MAKKSVHYQNAKNQKLDPKTVFVLESKFKKENINARKAGKEYGVLAMGLISIMATIAHSDVDSIRKYIIDASECLNEKLYIEPEEIIEKVNEKMNSRVSKDDIVNADPTFGRFF